MEQGPCGKKSEAEITPKGAINAGQSLSHGEAVPAPVVPKAWPPPTKRRWRLGRRSWYPKFFARYRSQNFDHCHSFLLASSATGGARKRPPLHKGALGTGDADCRVASLLAMTVLNLCHSEEAQRADVGIRPFYDGRGFGPPRSSAPTEGLPKSQQRADVPKAWLPPTKFRAEIWGVGQVVGPYGKPNQPPKPAGAQRSVRARGREGWAGIGARTIPKGDRPRDRPGSA